MGSDKKQQKVQASGFTKEEELLLQDFSRNVSTKSSALFYGNAFIVSAVPICKWHVNNGQWFKQNRSSNYRFIIF